MHSTALDWFNSHLTGRTQFIAHNIRQTPSFPVDCSVRISVLSLVHWDSFRTSRTWSKWWIDTVFDHTCMPTTPSTSSVQMTQIRYDLVCLTVHLTLSTSLYGAHRVNGLLLSANKTQVVCFGSSWNLTKWNAVSRSVQDGSWTIQPSAIVH